MIKQFLKRNTYLVHIYERIFDNYINPFNYKRKRKLKIARLRKQSSKYSFGEQNPDKTFAVLKKEVGACGPFAYVFKAVYPFLVTCKKNGCIPLIDLTDQECIVFRSEGNRGNAWEFYFEQPTTEYSLNDVYESKNVIIDNGYNFSKKMNVHYELQLLNMKDEEKAAMSCVIRQYIRPCERIRDRVEELEKELFGNNKVLGVSLRSEFKMGELVQDSLYRNHPKVAVCEEYIDAITVLLKKWEYDFFFLACDGREYSDQIKAHFGDKCLQMNRPLMHWFEDETRKMCEFEHYSLEDKTEDYLVETLLLTKCDGLYGSVCSQSRFAYIFASDLYQHVLFDEHGRIQF